jgi:hypothetical protein
VGDSTHAEVTLHIPVGGIPTGVVVAVGGAHEIPDSYLTPDVRQILLTGGRIVISDDDANYGKLNDWDASEWSQHLDGIDVDTTWGMGGSYGPGSESTRQGTVHYHAEIEGDPALTLGSLLRLRDKGKTLQDAIDSLHIPAVAYPVGDAEVEV